MPRPGGHRARITCGDSARRSGLLTVLLDAVAIIAGVVVYFGVRGQTAGDPSTALAHAKDILRWEKALGLDVEMGMQAALGGIGWLTTFANWIYVWGHWPLIVLTMVWLAVRDRAVFRRLRDAMLVSGLMGLCVYVTYPVAPPRLSGLGMTDTVAEQSGAYRVLQPAAFVNQYAAMPSLHVGWDLLVGLSIVLAAGSWTVRLLGAALPVMMALATVLTANHYVLDVIVGAGFGLTGWYAALLISRRSTRVAPPPPPELPRPRDGSAPPTAPASTPAATAATAATAAAAARRAGPGQPVPGPATAFVPPVVPAAPVRPAPPVVRPTPSSDDGRL